MEKKVRYAVCVVSYQPGHFFTMQSAGEFSHQLFCVPRQLFGNCECPIGVFAIFSYRRSTCHNHVIYVTRQSPPSHFGVGCCTHIFRGGARSFFGPTTNALLKVLLHVYLRLVANIKKLMFNSIYIFIVTGGESGSRNVPCDRTTTTSALEALRDALYKSTTTRAYYYYHHCASFSLMSDQLHYL